MKITKEDEDLEQYDPLLCEIKQMKEGVKTQEELVAT
jgi:putative transposase